MIVAGDEPGNLGSASFDAPAVRRKDRNPRSFARYDVYGVVDALAVVPREIVVAAEIVGGNHGRHPRSVPAPPPGGQCPMASAQSVVTLFAGIADEEVQ